MQEKQIKDKGQIYIDKGNEINKKAVKYGCVLLGYSIKCGGVVYGTTARVKNLFFGDVQKKSR